MSVRIVDSIPCNTCRQPMHWHGSVIVDQDGNPPHWKCHNRECKSHLLPFWAYHAGAVHTSTQRGARQG